jgi:hypothetical protein
MFQVDSAMPSVTAASHVKKMWRLLASGATENILGHH